MWALNNKKIKWCIYGFLIICLVIPHKGVSQSTISSYEGQRNQIFIYNTLLNGFIGGLGGAINKKKEEKLVNAFGKNFLKGTLGGLVKYTAKYETFQFANGKNKLLSYPNRLFYFLGHSFVNNASLNRHLFKYYNFQIYGVDLNFNLEHKFKVQTRASVYTLYSLGVMIGEGHKLNPIKSLEYGVFYFDWNKDVYSPYGGYALHNTLVLREGNQNHSEVHEIIHIYQKFDYFLLSNFFEKSFKKIKSKKVVQTFNKYLYADIFYSDLLYYFQPKPAHFKNFYEFEAESLSTRQFILR